MQYIITKCVDYFMIQKRRKLSWCAITQSFKSFQQSFDGVFSNASLQKILKLVLSSNRRHFLFRNVGYSGRCTMINRLLPKTKVVSLCGGMFSFLSYFFERYDFFYDFNGLLKRKVNSVTIFVILSFVDAKNRIFGKLRRTGRNTPMTPCVTTSNVKEMSDHRGRHRSRIWRNTKTFRGKHHQVAKALEAVTISNMTTTEEPKVEEKQPAEKKVVGKSQRLYDSTLHGLKATSQTCAP